MKPTDFVSVIIHFFNDLIGSVVPGLVLLIGLHINGFFPVKLVGEFLLIGVSGEWTLLVLLSYILGHGLISLHRLTQPYIGIPMRLINKGIKKWEFNAKSNEKIITESDTYTKLLLVMTKKIGKDLESEIEFIPTYNNLRSMAMTISQEAGEIARRFMFISLFCYGVSMAVISVGIAHMINDFHLEYLFAYVLVFFLFYSRGLDFEFRAENVPFPVALSELLFLTNKKDE